MRRKKPGLQFHSNKLTTWKCLKEESTSHWVSFVDFYSIPLFSIFFCINQITRWKQKNILSWVCMNIHISPQPQKDLPHWMKGIYEWSLGILIILYDEMNLKISEFYFIKQLFISHDWGIFFCMIIKKMIRWQQMGKSLKKNSAVSSSLMNLLK